MSFDEWRIRAGALAEEIMGRFFVPRELPQFLPKFEEIKSSLPPKYLELAAAFEKNVSAVVATVGIPVTLASAAAEGSHWQRIHAAERIRASPLIGEPGENDPALNASRNERALKIASEKMREFVASSDGRDKIAADACAFLSQALRFSNLSGAADELILQGTVLTWSALEILSRDLFEAILNSDPRRALAVMQEPAAKQRLQSKFTLEELASIGFNFSSCLGSLLSSQQDFSDIRTIKAAIVPALNSDPAVAAALCEKRLWVLCQQRHVIVHRRGVIDATYLEATGEQQPIGSRLSVKPDELQSQLDAVVAAGTTLLSAAGRHAS